MSCLSGSCHEILTLKDKICTLFGEAGFVVFNQDRFGMKSCIDQYDPYFLQDLTQILCAAQELDNCDRALDSCLGCDLKTIQQRISTL
jgi:hypothetical protein